MFTSLLPGGWASWPQRLCQNHCAIRVRAYAQGDHPMYRYRWVPVNPNVGKSKWLIRKPSGNQTYISHVLNWMLHSKRACRTIFTWHCLDYPGLTYLYVSVHLNVTLLRGGGCIGGYPCRAQCFTQMLPVWHPSTKGHQCTKQVSIRAYVQSELGSSTPTVPCRTASCFLSWHHLVQNQTSETCDLWILRATLHGRGHRCQNPCSGIINTVVLAKFNSAFISCFPAVFINYADCFTLWREKHMFDSF